VFSGWDSCEYPSGNVCYTHPGGGRWVRARFDACQPTTSCAAQGHTCGQVWNGCSYETCGGYGGGCPAGQTCNGATCQSSAPQITYEELNLSPYSANTAYLNNYVQIWGNNFCGNPQVYINGVWEYAYQAGTNQINAYIYSNTPLYGQYLYVVCNGAWSNPIYVNVTNPVPAVSCTLYGPSVVNIGQYGYWYGYSTPPGYYAYWYGTKNGSWDALGVYAGYTNFSFSAYYDASTAGNYSRYLVITDGSGNTVCTSNTVYTSVY
jgi:hypothetical protein